MNGLLRSVDLFLKHSHLVHCPGRQNERIVQSKMNI